MDKRLSDIADRLGVDPDDPAVLRDLEAIRDAPNPTTPQAEQMDPPDAETKPGEDIDAAAQRMGWKLGSRREMKKLPSHLHDGETVQEMARGQYGGGTGLLVLTSERIIFLREGWVGAAHEDFMLHRVTSVGFTSRFGFGQVTIHASGNTVHIESVLSDDGKRFAAAARKVLSRPAESAPAAQADPLEQLKKLGELRDAGVISPEEFEQKKTDLLGKI